MSEEEKKRKFGSVSISIGILEEIDKLIEELRFWPSRSAFVREACIEKMRHEREERKARRAEDSESKEVKTL